MSKAPTTEKKRLAVQATLDVTKTESERNQMGQFATPSALAMEILAYAEKLLPLKASIRFLDPAFGTGAFYSSLLRTFPASRIAAAAGFEIDPHYGKPAIKLWQDTPLKLRLEDFTQCIPPQSADDRYNLIICNPPYVRHHYIGKTEKLRLQHKAKMTCGMKISGLAGMYCYYISLSHPWMAENGIAGWLIPSEFMDVNYGRQVKQYLLDHVTLLRIHRFDPNQVQFKDALVSSAIVWFQNAKPAVEHQVEFTFGGSLAKPTISKMIPNSILRDHAKWTRFPTSGGKELAAEVTLGDLFTIKRGLATGNNSFFILTREQIEDYELPMEFFRPILPSPRYVKSNEIYSDERGYPLLDPQLLLLDCRLPEGIIKSQYSALWAYLEMGKARGVHERYLCRHRSPWYIQENRPPSMFLCNYMGRGNMKKRQPFRFILNDSKATAPNVYLLMYPKPNLARELRDKPSLARRIWEILNDISPQVIVAEGRIYGGGLHKMEPKELANVPAHQILQQLPHTAAEAILASIHS